MSINSYPHCGSPHTSHLLPRDEEAASKQPQTPALGPIPYFNLKIQPISPGIEPASIASHHPKDALTYSQPHKQPLLAQQQPPPQHHASKPFPAAHNPTHLPPQPPSISVPRSSATTEHGGKGHVTSASSPPLPHAHPPLHAHTSTTAATTIAPAVSSRGGGGGGGQGQPRVPTPPMANNTPSPSSWIGWGCGARG